MPEYYDEHCTIENYYVFLNEYYATDKNKLDN